MVPPLLVYLLILLEGEYTHCDRANLIVATSDKVALAGKNIYNLSFAYLAIALNALDSARKNPRVATQ
jgi:hypothetical protein